MKKIFFALAALVLAFTGCSQEEDAIQVSEKKAVKVVVNMDKPGFGEDTRAPRTGWETGDEVEIMLDGDLGHLISLTYDGTGWEVMVRYYDFGEYRRMMDESDVNEYLASLHNSGDLKAIYCSSGIIRAMPYPVGEAFENLEGIDIISRARDYGYYEDPLNYISTPYGECIMTCENGEYEVEETADGYVLKLTITMIPQVAQFTIRNLSDDGDDEEGKTSEGLEVGVAGGNLITYAGGTINKTEGIILDPLVHLDGYNACWVHPNTDGISIYASVDAETNEFADYETYTFSVGDDYYRDFNCNEYKSSIYNGAAIIMDGPYTDGAASKWGEPE